MNIYNFNIWNTKPVSGAYLLDEDVNIKHVDEYTDDGLTLSLTNALSDLQDTTFNKDTNFYLSDEKTIENILDIQPTQVNYPIYRQTWLENTAYSRFIVVDTSTGYTEVTGVSASVDNRSIFELEILNDQYTAIRHYDPSTRLLKYLTLSANNTTAKRDTILSFTPRVSASAFADDSQIFEYVLDEDNNTLSLFESSSGTCLIVMKQHAQTDGRQARSYAFYPLSSVNVSVGPISYSSTVPDMGKWKIRPIKKTPSVFNLKSTWSSYLSSIDDNHLNIDSNRSVDNVSNNFLLNTTTNKIVTQDYPHSGPNYIDINLMPLKNQLTVEGNQSRSNPYSGAESETTQRVYNKIHTGSKQEQGSDSIYMNYVANTMATVIPSDKLTYFHMPQDMRPYKQININDTTLAKIGGIPGSSPIKADKVFKKRADNFNTTHPRDELNGTWLCAWLSGSPNSSNLPVWVDRYYNPGIETTVTAITADKSDIVKYIDSRVSITKKLSAENIRVYDKISDLVFEPGALYAYSHIGNKDAKKIIEKLNGTLMIDGVSQYKNASFVDVKLPVDNVLVFNSDNYGVTEEIEHKGSFTLSFWMHCNNWEQPFAHQFLGNYLNRGFGLFNEPAVTPIITVPNGGDIEVYNSDFNRIDRHIINEQIKHITKHGGTGNYWVATTAHDVYEYDAKGTIQNKITSFNTTNYPNRHITDIEISNDKLYLLMEPVAGWDKATTCKYFIYDLKEQTSGYIGTSGTASLANYSPSVSSTGRIHSFNTLSGDIITVVACDALSGNESLVDNFSRPWWVHDNRVYTYDVTTSAVQIGLSALSGQTIDGINCDKDNNLWVLHGESYTAGGAISGANKVTKIDNDRNILFTVSLTSSPPLSSDTVRYIDFVDEFTNTGYKSSAIVINQTIINGGDNVVPGYTTNGTVSGKAVAVKISSDGYIESYNDIPGSIMTYSGVNSISAFNWKTITGYDYLRKNKLNLKPRIEAKLGVSNLYNTTTTTQSYSAFTLTYNLTGMNAGWHHFGVRFNAELGDYEMYIDTQLVDSVSIPGGKFSYSNMFEQPLLVGATPFYSNVPLSEFIQQPRHYHANNIKIRDIKLYNSSLEYFDLKAHYLANTDIRDIVWDVSTGQRNYIDTVERVFKHTVPGRKSEVYDINIKNSGITDASLKEGLQDKIIEQLGDIVPVHTKLNDMMWNGTSLSAVSGI
tara:strand:- start:5916 stop:9506 length:3591 start_codon:yes stop_codon:yes gene_type:complete